MIFVLTILYIIYVYMRCYALCKFPVFILCASSGVCVLCVCMCDKNNSVMKQRVYCRINWEVEPHLVHYKSPIVRSMARLLSSPPSSYVQFSMIKWQWNKMSCSLTITLFLLRICLIFFFFFWNAFYMLQYFVCVISFIVCGEKKNVRKKIKRTNSSTKFWMGSFR